MHCNENREQNVRREERMNTDMLYEHWWKLTPDQRRQEFKTPSEIAPNLDRTPKSVCRMADEGRIPRVKIGGRIYVHEPSLLHKLKQDDGLTPSARASR